MRKLLFILLLAIPMIAAAETYTVTASWPDPTPAGAGYTPVYDAEWRINGGSSNPINDLSSTAFNTAITATPSDLIEVRVRARNTQGPTTGPWGPWAGEQFPAPPLVPLQQGAVTIQFTIIAP